MNVKKIQKGDFPKSPHMFLKNLQSGEVRYENSHYQKDVHSSFHLRHEK